MNLKRRVIQSLMAGIAILATPTSLCAQKADTITTVLTDTISANIPDTALPLTDIISEREVIVVEETDSIGPTVVTAPGYTLEGRKEFNPDPARATWLSALFPGLGQIYNRRYWKLPIIVAGFMGLGYGTSWNARMYSDYSLAYQDIMDDNPDTNSYMDFFPPTVDESSLDKTWLAQTFKSRKDYYRRNRDLCIICCVGVYLLCMVDAYVDAHLTHFDISPNLSMDVAPSIINDPLNARPKLAMHWAITF
ncbi:MAG: hypothetical protein K2M03_00145 [Muribaculaceae bacterium]|nr:hypothetical protein [Muribaculaceae bacterium]